MECILSFILSSNVSAGSQRICLIILNQPLDKDYLEILWSKGTLIIVWSIVHSAKS